jgi:predicted SnoaL-like aldol condensation-catalyzing enzyme
MSTEDNKVIIRRFYEEVWNKGNVTAVDELLAPTYVNHFDSPTNVSVPEHFQQNREEAKHFIPPMAYHLLRLAFYS